MCAVVNYYISNMEIFAILYKTLVEQGVPRLHRVIRKNYTYLYILWFSWIIASSCITRSFKSILLKTYYKTKPSLTVNKLEDIVNKPELLISGSYDLYPIEQYKPDVYRQLMRRAISYETQLGIDYNTHNGILASYSKSIFQRVNDRKGVVITNTYGTDLFKRMYPMYNLMESDIKYMQIFLYSVVHKNIPHYIRINKL